MKCHELDLQSTDTNPDQMKKVRVKIHSNIKEMLSTLSVRCILTEKFKKHLKYIVL